MRFIALALALLAAPALYACDGFGAVCAPQFSVQKQVAAPVYQIPVQRVYVQQQAVVQRQVIQKQVVPVVQKQVVRQNIFKSRVPQRSVVRQRTVIRGVR